jgi:hypothetical protein
MRTSEELISAPLNYIFVNMSCLKVLIMDSYFLNTKCSKLKDDLSHLCKRGCLVCCSDSDCDEHPDQKLDFQNIQLTPELGMF